MIRAAVIGLGFAGFRFELDPLRAGIWSHAAAYKAAAGVRLVAAAEPDEARRRDFHARYPEVPAYADLSEMLSRHTVDLASVCVPTGRHAAVVRALAGRVRGIFCEKPMGATLEDAREIVELCERHQTLLGVNFVRRWEQAYLQAKKVLAEGLMGSLRSIAGYYPGELYNIGTHLVDIMCFLAGRVQAVAGIMTHGEGEREPAGSALLRFSSGASGCIATHGTRRNALFEVDLLFENGRLRITENGRRLDCWRYRPSRAYTGYNELETADLPVSAFPVEDRMLRAVDSIAACFSNPGQTPACSGRDALHAQMVVSAIAASHREQAFVTL